jgi:hypothetical protein
VGTRLAGESADLRKEWKELHIDVPLPDGTSMHIVLLQSEHWWRARQFSIGHGIELNMPKLSYQGKGVLTAVRPAEWAAASESEVKAVFHRLHDEDSGMLVLGARRSRTKESFARRCAVLRLVSLMTLERRGDLARRVFLNVLRSVEWLRTHKITVGNLVYFDFFGYGDVPANFGSFLPVGVAKGITSSIDDTNE